MLHIFKASAGSGKTFTLAKEYLTLLLAIKEPGTDRYALNLDPERRFLLQPLPHRKILAITFTRKATEEMKRRIIKELAALSRIPAPGEKDSLYAADMMATFLFRQAPCSRADLATAATYALHQLLFDYQNFNVSTIDAFFQRVMHTFARELGQQNDYNIELQPEAAMRNAVGIMLDDFNTQPQGNPQLEAWLTNYMRRQMEEGKQANFFNRRTKTHGRLIELISYISKESFQEFEQRTLEYLRAPDLDTFAAKLQDSQKAILSEIQVRAQEIANTGAIEFLAKNTRFYKDFPALLAGKPIKDINHYKTALGQKILDGSPFFKKSSTKNRKEKADCINGVPEGHGVCVTPYERSECGDLEEEEEVREFFIFAHQKYVIYFLLKEISESLSQLGLLRHAWGYLDQFNRDNNTVLLSQTNNLVSQIIDHDNTPFVYERMGVRLEHFLIDEFQDTSALQWQNLWPLVHNALSQDGDSLVIGDEKQSIYRWRNSDSEILHTGIEKQLTQVGLSPKLSGGNTTNYRSAHQVVRFNNTLFSYLAQAYDIPGFDNVAQGLAPGLADQPAYIHFVPIASPNPGCITPHQPGGITPHQPSLEEMAREMLRQHSAGYSWSDIAVLVRTNTHAAEVINYLAKNHPQINVLSEEALKVGSSNAVQLVVNTLRIIDQEQQEQQEPQPLTANLKPLTANLKPLTANLKTLIHRFGFHLTKIIEEQNNGGPQADLPQPSPIVAALASTFGPQADPLQAIRDKKPATLVALVETIIGSHFSAAERQKQFTYLSAFQDLVIDYCDTHQGSIHAFLDWWDTTGSQRNVSGAADADAVQVLTIHKAKGLEWPCVHIPFCTWQVYGSRPSSMWIPFPEIRGLDAKQAPPALYLTLSSSCDKPDHPLHRIYVQERQKLRTDNANLTYVAFTRAANELCVWYASEKSSADNPSTADWLTEAFAQATCPPGSDLHLNLPDYLRDGELTIGAPTTKLTKDKAKDRTVTVATDDPYPVHFPTYASSLIALNDALDIDKDIDDAPAEQLPEFNDQALQMGNDLHEIMSHIVTIDDLDKAVNLLAARRRLDEPTKDSYYSTVATFLHSSDPRIARWFDPEAQVFIEQSIFIPSQDQMRRPDRIVVYPDGSADILDYKFTSDPEAVNNKKYHAQVREYTRLVADLGYTPVRAYICFPLLDKIISQS